jgi:hypothetical protein
MAKTERGAGSVTLRFTPTAAERERIFLARLEAAGAIYARFARLLPVLVVGMGIVALALAADVLPGLSGRRLAGAIAILGLLVIVPMLVLTVPPLRRRVVFRGGGEETLHVGGDGVAWEMAGRPREEHRWADIAAVEEHGGVLLFIPRHGVAVGVPARAAEDAETRERLRTLARRRLGERARLGGRR